MSSRFTASHVFATLILLGFAPAASGQVILSPVSGVVDAGGPGTALGSTYDQSGLSVNFISGTTDFAAYMALNPTHSFVLDHEWFSEGGTSSAIVTYDLGSVFSVSALALWNEELSGIGRLDLFGSTDGVSFFELALGLAPTNNDGFSYAADIFGFAARDARFVQLQMSECPQEGPQFPYQSCAVGEVAFAAGMAQQVVPEPMTMLLLGSGLVGLGGAARRRRPAFGASLQA